MTTSKRPAKKQGRTERPGKLPPSTKKDRPRSSPVATNADTTVALSPSGDLRIPAKIVKAAGLMGGASVAILRVGGGLLISPASEMLEVYTPERRAEFLLNNAMDAADYAAAVKSVRKLGLDPARIPHERPVGA